MPTDVKTVIRQLELDLSQIEGMNLAFSNGKSIFAGSIYRRSLAHSHWLFIKGKDGLLSPVGEVISLDISGAANAHFTNNWHKKRAMRLATYADYNTPKNLRAVHKINWLGHLANDAIDITLAVRVEGKRQFWTITRAISLNPQWFIANFKGNMRDLFKYGHRVDIEPELKATVLPEPEPKLNPEVGLLEKQLIALFKLREPQNTVGLSSATRQELEQAIVDMSSNAIKRYARIDWLCDVDRDIAWRAAMRRSQNADGSNNMMRLAELLKEDVIRRCEAYDKNGY